MYLQNEFIVFSDIIWGAVTIAMHYKCNILCVTIKTNQEKYYIEWSLGFNRSFPEKSAVSDELVK